ncbi:MAG: site-2 protease family protein [Oscillospiraceae bacterium]|nr:site-2 protease family protein [Oscillospiraceae bacterium]
MNDRITSIVIHGIVLLIAFPVHECSHALAAHWMGDDTAKDQGRMTLNPLKHLDLFGTIFMLVGGFGWAKAVPINPNNFKNRKVGMALSSLAGPVSNLIMAYISIILCKIFAYSVFFDPVEPHPYIGALTTFFMYAVFLNVGLAVFNLLPVPPLDGSRIFNLILPEKLYFKIMRYENIIFGLLFLAVFMGFLDKPISYLQDTAVIIMDSISRWVDWLMILLV